MIVLMDNYDSFSYNLYQLAAGFSHPIKVVRNDSCTLEELEQLHPQALIVSPGPGKPSQAGICEEAIRHFAGKIPILGVCLGHQAICEVFGAEISYAKELIHGKPALVHKAAESILWEGLTDPFLAARYHSLSARKETLPSCLRVTGVAEDGEIMAVEHVKFPVYGVQFHPESVMTPGGKQMMENFMSMVEQDDQKTGGRL